MNINKQIKQGIVISIIILFLGASIVPGINGSFEKSITNTNSENIITPLPRWREGGTPYDDKQSLNPYEISNTIFKDDPSTGLISSPPEYDPVHGVLFWYNSGHWTETVTDCVVALTQEDEYDEIAYVVVTSTTQRSYANSEFIAGGANMSKVVFIIEPGNSVWLRDYGPHFIWQDGALAIVDSHYYPTRPLDNFNPTVLGDDNFIMPTYDMGLYYSGGNFQPGPNRTGFVTSLMTLDNPSSQGFDTAFIGQLFQQYQGIDTLHMMPQLPWSVDGTGHIDMWMYLVDEDSVIISEFKPGSDPSAISITNNAVPYMEALGFTVYRPYAWNSGGTHYTYTNAFRVNDRIFIPAYGYGNSNYRDEDDYALAMWEAAAGSEVEIIQIDCYDIIPAAGAIHCIVMQIPRYTDPEPAVHVISPAGGELLVSGTSHTIKWVATDTNNAVIPQIELYYSLNNGGTYDYIDTTTDTGFYEWTVPFNDTDQALVKVVAISSDLDQTEGISSSVFEIKQVQQNYYDFTTSAGIDRFGYGYRTTSWSNINGNQMPVSSEIDSLVAGAYNKISYSDATGGDTDTNRYISPTISSSYETTHIYEFTIDEDIPQIEDLGILWEGYADDCTQIELYIWDHNENQWSDGEGQTGQNRYMNCYAGNRDEKLEKHIRSNYDNYIDENGILTLLLYGERGGDKSFHDHILVTISGNITGYNHPPNIPADPIPSDGQYNVDLDTILSWTGGDPDPGDTVTYDVYFGTTNPPPLVTTGITETEYNPGTLDYLDYYWKIVASDGNKTSESPIWWFTPSLPEVYMMVESTSAPTGTNGLEIDVVGKWNTSIGAYAMVLNYDSNLIEFDHIDFLGTIGETASYKPVDEPEGPGNISAGAIWIPATAGPEAGEGLLFKVFVNITGTFTEGSSILSLIEAWPDPISGPSKTKYTNQQGFGYTPIMIDGEISISDVVCGDADGSGDVDIDDVVYLINYIFASGPEPVPQYCVGDADGSGEVDIDDVVYLINYIFASGPAPVPTCCS